MLDVGAICIRDVVVAKETDTLPAVAELMRSGHVGDVVVVQQRDGKNYPTGIITDRDIVVEGVAEAADRLSTLAAGDLKTRPLVTIKATDIVDDALDVMREQGVRRAPVVDGAGALVGILSVDDVIELFAARLSKIVSLFARQRQDERDFRP